MGTIIFRNAWDGGVDNSVEIFVSGVVHWELVLYHLICVLGQLGTDSLRTRACFKYRNKSTAGSIKYLLTYGSPASVKNNNNCRHICEINFDECAPLLHTLDLRCGQPNYSTRADVSPAGTICVIRSITFRWQPFDIALV